MNDIEFRQRAIANPRDTSPEFAAARAESAERQQLVADMIEFDSRLQKAFAIEAPQGLKQKLLKPETPESVSTDTLVQPAQADAHPRQWVKAMPLAASLVLAIAVALGGFTYMAGSADRAFAEEVMDHLYSEMGLLESNSELTYAEVNQLLDQADVSVRLLESPDGNSAELLKVTGAKDCWILRNDNFHLSMHLVMQGDRGKITVMVVPSSPVKNPINIADNRFDGIITPTEMGNVVVIGEKQEAVSRMSTLVANNIRW